MAAEAPGSDARARILAASGALFYERGFHAVGVDLVIERAGVAKATLYRHFPSKDDLIAAYLTDANAQFWAWLDAAIGDRTGLDALEAVFDAVGDLATSPTCRGCAFQVTAAEFPDPAHAGHDVAVAHKRQVHARLRELADQAAVPDPTATADGLLMLMDGAFAAARMHGPDNPARSLAATARALIAAALAEP